MNKKYYAFLLLSALSLQNCLMTPGSGDDLPNVIQRDPTSSSSTCDSSIPDFLSDTDSAADNLVDYRSLFLPATIYNLTVEEGPSGDGFIVVKFRLGDYKTSLTNCRAAARFYRGVDDPTSLQKSNALDSTVITAEEVTLGEYFLPDIGFPGNSVVGGLVYAYVECGSVTTNVLFTYFSQ